MKSIVCLLLFCSTAFSFDVSNFGIFPYPAMPGGDETFFTSLDTPENATYSLDFGDGTSDKSIFGITHHVYSNVGTYLVTLIVDNGTESIKYFLSIDVVSTTVGSGPDSDLDGFSDSFEILVGSNPFDPTSVPTTLPVKQTNIQHAKIRLNLKSPGHDVMDISLWVIGKQSSNDIFIDFGGVQRKFKLKNGRAKNGGYCIYHGTIINFHLTGDLQTALTKYSGFANDNITEFRNIVFSMVSDNQPQRSELSFIYSAKKNRVGIAIPGHALE